MSSTAKEISSEYLNIIGARLKGVRLLKGITQQQAAEDTGITHMGSCNKKICINKY